MGAAQSTRKITLVDDEKAGVIKLSESLAQRLRGQIEGQQAAVSERTGPAVPPEPAPFPPPPPPQSIERPLPAVPEPPKIPAVVPVIPETPAPKPIPREVTPEPEPQTQGESHPSDTVIVDASQETSLSVLSPSDDIAVGSQAETEVSGSDRLTDSAAEALASDAAADAVADASSSVPSPDLINVPPSVSAVGETSLVSDEAKIPAIGTLVEVQLPSAETLLTAAFGSDAVENGPPSSVAEAPQSKPPTLVLPVPHQVEEPSSSGSPDIGVAIRAGPGPTLSQPAGTIPPWSIYAEEAHLMVMRLREEKEQEIKKLNQEWREKMDAREKEFTKMAQLSEEQVGSALKEVESLFMKASCTPVCQNQQEGVMKCYQDHPRQSLRCAREVEHFAQCVDLSRLQSIMKQEVH